MSNQRLRLLLRPASAIVIKWSLFTGPYWLPYRLNMSKGEKEGFIVKFVESKGQKTEYAVKAYEVNAIIWLKYIVLFTFLPYPYWLLVCSW